MRELGILCLLAAAATPAFAAQQVQQSNPAPPPAPQYQESVEVVGVTPIHGSGLPSTLVPSNVQVFGSTHLGSRQVLDVGSFLSSRGASVQTSDVQAGTFQPDVVFRGFTASPLLGASQGIAVYLDGVRVNDPFGDTVAWDILPTVAVSSINLMPGSNPLFGLNALGGALSLRTKDGFAAAGERFSYATGAFGRHHLEAESGGHRNSLAYYVAGTFTRESGWRDFSPSTVRRVFGNAAWRGGSSSVVVSVTAAANDLSGNGGAPVSLLESDREAVFTHPDKAGNDVALVVINAHRQIRPDLALEAAGYIRGSRLHTFNGDEADDDGEPDGNGDPAFDAVNNTSRTSGHGAGVTGQVTRTGTLGGRASHFVLGAGVDASATRFEFAAEHAMLAEDRGTVGSGLFDEDASILLRTRAVTGSGFLSETWSVTSRMSLSGAARFNWTSVALRDQLGDALNGDHQFARVNPAVGVTYQAGAAVNVYGSYAESSRVPSPVELTCADPEDPCRLPNAFVSDPPLAQIVGRTFETGARGRLRAMRWSAAAFRTTSVDDIVFVSSGTLRGEGHFENVDRTRRTGVETSVDLAVTSRIAGYAAYTVQRATFGTDLRIASPMHPDAENGGIAVKAGDRLPGVPSHAGKAGVTVNATDRLQIGFDVQAQSGVFLRGDEANLLPEVPAFVRADVRARMQVTRHVAVTGQVQNLFDARFATFGVLGDASLVGSSDQRFYSPGAPRGAWAGVEVAF